MTIGAFATVVLALGGGGLGVWSYYEPAFLPLASLGTIGAALGIVASRREELTQDERNAERFGRTWKMLSRIRQAHSRVQRAVARG